MKVRPRIQRAFLAWLAEARPRFGRQVLVRDRTDRLLAFGFDVGGPVLQGRLSRDGLSIAAEDGGTCWDTLIDLDALPERCDGGIVCGLCPPDGRRVFADCEELWRDHLFEPFLAWVNGELVPAAGLALFAIPSGGITWAGLVRNPEAACAATKVVPLDRGPGIL